MIRKDVKRKRISSYDHSGANMDNRLIEPKRTLEVCNIDGTGIIRHIWITIASSTPHYLREIVIRMWWDNEEHPSVEVPIGDFFGVGHAIAVNYWSLPLSMGPRDGKGFNCFFPMPFSTNARIEIVNEGDIATVCYFYVDYEEYKELPSNLGRFHASWRRENPTAGNEYGTGKKVEMFIRKNKNHDNDYLILNAEGEGHFVGCHLDVHNLMTEENKHKNDNLWQGEGDDYIEIDDGEIVLYGTGTEDYFCTAWSPQEYYCSPYYGSPLPGGEGWRGKISYYRYHIEDPIYFHKNIKVKIEHGHANQRSDDYSSTAYWYQTEPHKLFEKFLSVEDRIPRDEPK